jgi:hypothetical protein
LENRKLKLGRRAAKRESDAEVKAAGKENIVSKFFSSLRTYYL